MGIRDRARGGRRRSASLPSLPPPAARHRLPPPPRWYLLQLDFIRRMDPSDPTLPGPGAPHDALRRGLASLKDDPSARPGGVEGCHPLARVLGPAAQAHEALQRDVRLAATYGGALPARLDLERQAAAGPVGFPGGPGGSAGAELAMLITGSGNDALTPSDLYGRPEDAPERQPGVHAELDARAGGRGVPIVTRALP